MYILTLIDKLQTIYKEKGNIEVCCGEKAILSVYACGAGEKGPLNKVQLINNDHVGSYIQKGTKAYMECQSITDLIEMGMLRQENIDYSQLTPYAQTIYKKIHTNLINIQNDIQYNIVFDSFKKWYQAISETSDEEMRLDVEIGQIEEVFEKIKDDILHLDSYERQEYYKNKLYIQNSPTYGKMLLIKEES